MIPHEIQEKINAKRSEARKDPSNTAAVRIAYGIGLKEGAEIALESSPVNPLLSPLKEAIEALKKAEKEIGILNVQLKGILPRTLLTIEIREVINKSSKLIQP